MTHCAILCIMPLRKLLMISHLLFYFLGTEAAEKTELFNYTDRVICTFYEQKIEG